MEYKQIKKLMDDMGESKLTAIDIEFPDGIKISMKKEYANLVQSPKQMIELPQTQVNVTTAPSVVKEECTKEIQEDFKCITSPMVGTFYSKSSPTAKSLVEVGSKVKKGDILCIIEAMKLMNEIESEFDGEIVEICVKDQEIVDYGKVLFKIK